MSDRYEQFVKRALEKYGDLFDYSESIYVNAKTRLNIRCKKHDLVFNQTPDKHLNSKHSCPKCLQENKKKAVFIKKKETKPHSVYIESIKKIFGIDIEIISGVGRHTQVSFECERHGSQTDSVDNLVQGQRKYACINCAKENRSLNKIHCKNKVMTELSEKHPSYVFTISKTYRTKRDLIECVCNKKHKFKISVQKLLAGRQCPQCNLDRLINENRLPGGYNEYLFKTNKELKESEGYLYWMKLGEYYKIGITRVSAESRKKSLKYKCNCDVDILYEIKMNLYEAFKIEQILLKEFQRYRVYGGFSTELFSKDITENFLTKIK